LNLFIDNRNPNIQGLDDSKDETYYINHDCEAYVVFLLGPSMPFVSKSYEQFHVVMCTGGLGSQSYDSCCCVFCPISFPVLLCWARGLFWEQLERIYLICFYVLKMFLKKIVLFFIFFFASN
jgi:hypothetical protein